jgi:hypothetical protein
MALGIIGGLASIILDGPTGEQSKWMTIAGFDAQDPGTLVLPEMPFQYWPEEIQDSIEVGWNFLPIPGASHDVAQWNGNSGRTISFEVVLSRLMKPTKDRTTLETILDPFEMTKPEDSPGINGNVKGMVRYLRAFCYPAYAKGTPTTQVIPPPIAILYCPGLGLNEQGGDAIFAVMTGCDITYRKTFANGVPRTVSMSLTFKQVVQDLVGVSFVGRKVASQAAGTVPYATLDGSGYPISDPAAHDVGDIKAPGDHLA